MRQGPLGGSVPPRGFANIKGSFRCRASRVAAISWPACRRPAPPASSAAADRSPTRGRRKPQTADRLRFQHLRCTQLHHRGPAAGERDFTDIRYMPHSLDAVARGEYSFDFDSVAGLLPFLDAGEPITVLAGVHSGCYELFAQEPIRTISELKGKRVGVSQLSSGRHLFLKVVAAYVGLDPETDINWVAIPKVKPAELSRLVRSTRFLASRPSPRSCARARSAG